MHSLLKTLALCGTALAVLPALATEYTITTLPGTDAGQNMQVFGLNNAGQVAGSINSTTGVSQQAFVWQAGTFTMLSGPAGALGAAALGIANNGVVVGSFYTALVDDGSGTLVPERVRGFVLDGGSYTVVEVPGASFTQLRGASPDGRWVSGYATVGGINQGFALDRSSGSTTFLGVANSVFTLPQGISGGGIVAGSDVIQPPGLASQRPAFLFDLSTGTRTDTQIVGYSRTAFRDIDESGNLVGWLSGTDATGAPLTQGFIGTPSSFQTLVVAGSDNTTLQGNNDAGWIVGNYVLGGQNFAFLATPVPEPAAALMVLAGCALVGATRRKRSAAPR